jgi:hypothetical protein
VRSEEPARDERTGRVGATPTRGRALLAALYGVVRSLTDPRPTAADTDRPDRLAIRRRQTYREFERSREFRPDE